VTDWSSYNINTIASALKLYLRDRPPCELLIPPDLTDELISIPQRHLEPHDAAQAFKTTLKKLSQPRLLTLAYLVGYLREVSQSATSRMNAKNLATVIAPCLLIPVDGATLDEQRSKSLQQNAPIQMLIDLYDDLFAEFPVPEDAVLTDEDMEIIADPPLSQRDAERLDELRKIRAQSLIPFMPHELIGDPKWIRPTRPFNQ
jgi:hypothetical protein